MQFSYWIQRHDYSSESENDVTAQQAIEAYIGVDWRRELAAYDEDREDRDCPPGIAIHIGYDDSNPDAMLLHICPKDAATVFLCLQRRSQKRVLGLWDLDVEDEKYADTVAGTLVPDLIRSFFALDPEPILRHCE